jgi:hypothetical protein
MAHSQAQKTAGSSLSATLSDDYAPSDLVSLSDVSTVAEVDPICDGEPLPHPVFYMKDGNVRFLVSVSGNALALIFQCLH